MVRTSPGNLEYPRHKARARIGREAARGWGFLLHRTAFLGRESGAAAKLRTYAGNVGTQDNLAQMKIILMADGVDPRVGQAQTYLPA
jgi:hypothetical protein